MFEPILSYFGGLVGFAVGLVSVTLIWWLLSYLFWGLIWTRIITKAGYRGDKRKTLIRLIYWPTLFAPVPIILFGEIPELLAATTILTTVPQWSAIYYFCFSKWPVQGETPKEETPSKTK